MRHKLVDGQGNFGSIDGDAAAAYRYTECRMGEAAAPLLDDIKNGTVPFRPNYDGTNEEPVVLPARYPNLLVNGGTGIAVGMATNIPPHNMAETIKACLKLLADPDIKDYQLVANDAVQGPDFPTGGQIIASREELREIYKTGSGRSSVRGHREDRRQAQDARHEDPGHRLDPLRRQQGDARRADRRHRERPEDAPHRRARGRTVHDVEIALDPQEGRRRRQGPRVPLQAHEPAGQLQLQPDLPRPHGEPRGLRARAPGPQGDPVALPPLPARRRHEAPRARARGPGEADPHPRGLRSRLRRPRRDHQDHPGVRRQGGRGEEDPEALQAARRGADRRDPRAEAVPPREARDQPRGRRAREEARARAAEIGELLGTTTGT